MRCVIVQIDSLVLRGFRYEDRHAVAEGLQRELARMLSAAEIVDQLSGACNVGRLNVEPVHVAAHARPQQIGAAAAKRIGEGIQR